MTAYTLKQASELLQTKQISAVELAQEYLTAIHAQNPALNGYVTLDQDKTLAEAQAAKTAELKAKRDAEEVADIDYNGHTFDYVASQSRIENHTYGRRNNTHTN